MEIQRDQHKDMLRQATGRKLLFSASQNNKAPLVERYAGQVVAITENPQDELDSSEPLRVDSWGSFEDSLPVNYVALRASINSNISVRSVDSTQLALVTQISKED